MTAQSREHFWWFWTAIEIVFVSMFFVLFAQPALANDQKVQCLIQESIASYPGKCACPYSLMYNGRKCGGQSAYSKPGGYSPLCYPKDVYWRYPSLKSTGTGTGLYNY